ncbi:MAG: hypothetical protein E7381_03445 [Clostridiales bacterium]|nr:hypothetical protein [Clostridiales bacterium]
MLHAVGKNACALVAQPAVAFEKACFRLTTAIAIEAQRLCLCTPRGNKFLDLFPCADKVGKNACALVTQPAVACWKACFCEGSSHARQGEPCVRSPFARTYALTHLAPTKHYQCFVLRVARPQPLTWVSVRRQGRQERLRVGNATYGCFWEGLSPSYDGDCHRGAKALPLHSARK